MKFVRNLLAAFALYSRIPTPKWEWRPEDWKYSLVFLPWVGAVVGACVVGITAIPGVNALPTLARVAIVALVPLLITGGFHFDGFLDVQDALRSYRSKEEKLQILKDPHIGAFALVETLVYALFWLAASTIVLEADRSFILTFASSFIISRALGGRLALILKSARNEGMLVMETKHADRLASVLLAAEATLGFGLSVAANCLAGSLCVFASSVFAMRFSRKFYREFGGVTGDAIGYFIVVCEEICLIATAVAACLVK